VRELCWFSTSQRAEQTRAEDVFAAPGRETREAREDAVLGA
jgi:hypothetical protein